MPSLIREAIRALKPPGPLWKPEPGEDFDNQLYGISDAIEDVKAVASSVGDIRNPDKTPCFTDLEINYGIKPNDIISDSIRIARLKRKVYQKAKVNSIEDLQNELDTAGFDLQVHKNDPAVDPASFLASFQMAAASDYAYAGFNLGGDILAVASAQTDEGYWLVNTDIFLQSIDTEMVAGGDIAYAGYTSDGISQEACAGYFTGYRQQILTYPNISDSGYWHMVYFVGGDVTRDVSGYITDIQKGQVDTNRYDELKEIILSCKNLSVWFALIIELV